MLKKKMLVAMLIVALMSSNLSILKLGFIGEGGVEISRHDPEPIREVKD